jgi:hypothetical protein
MIVKANYSVCCSPAQEFHISVAFSDKKGLYNQGEQIGRIFAYWVAVFFGWFL